MYTVEAKIVLDDRTVIQSGFDFWYDALEWAERLIAERNLEPKQMVFEKINWEV